METGLTKVEKFNALQRLELCIEMFDSPLSRKSDELEIDKALLPALIKANKDLGYAFDEDKLSYTFEGLATEIKKSVPNIRLAEIPIAINKGIMGDYGDYFGFTVVTIIKFLKAHYASGKRAEIAKQIPREEEEKPIPTKEEQLELSKKCLIDSFGKYKECGKLGYSGVFIYRILKEDFNLISFTNEVKWTLLHKAMQLSRTKKETGTLADYMGGKATREDIKVLNTLLDEYKDPIECAKRFVMENKGKSIYTQVTNEAERLSAIRFFDDLIEVDAEITDLLTN